MVTIIATQKVYKFTSPGSYCLSLKLLERVSYIPHLLFLTSYHLIRNPANMPSLLLMRWPVTTLAFDTGPLQLSSQAPPFLKLPLLGPVLHNLLRTPLSLLLCSYATRMLIPSESLNCQQPRWCPCLPSSPDPIEHGAGQRLLSQAWRVTGKAETKPGPWG